jgi:hypothetical protein
MHKDLSDKGRSAIEDSAYAIVAGVFRAGQSLGIAREAMINAFDRAAEELDA